MERFNPAVYIFEHGSNDRPVMAGFKKCLDSNCYFGLRPVALLCSSGIACLGFYFDGYYFTNFPDSDYLFGKIIFLKT